MYQILDMKQNIDIDIDIAIYTNIDIDLDLDLDLDIDLDMDVNIDLDMDVNIDCMYRLKCQYKKRPTYDLHKLVFHYDLTVYFKDTTS